jgi:hypothetical protein
VSLEHRRSAAANHATMAQEHNQVSRHQPRHQDATKPHLHKPSSKQAAGFAID